MPNFRVRMLAAASLTIILAPYFRIGIWLAQTQSIRSIPGYVLVVVAGILMPAFFARTWRWFLVLSLPSFFLSALFSTYIVVSGELPGDSIAYVLLTSSWDEVRGFFSVWHAPLALVLSLAFCLGYLVALACMPTRAFLPAVGYRTRWIAICTLALFSIYASNRPDDLMKGVAASPIVGTTLFISGPFATAYAKIHGKLARKIRYEAIRNESNETHVFIIGESSRRNSWSVYGYSRKTTPYMESLKGEAIFLQDAVSDANATAYAVPMLLTGMGPETFSFGAITGNLLDLAKEAGYFTSWLVNQDASVSQMLSIDADHVVYPHSSSELAVRSLSPDGVLLPQYARELTHHGASPLFVGMHVFGSHWGYFDRYPKDFEHFGPGSGLIFSSIYQAKADKRVIDSYDNSILYTDWFLEQIIERARTLDVPVTVTFVSDHGEDLYAFDGVTGHGWPTYSAGAFDIPAFVWMNAAYRLAHPDKVSALEANASKEIRSHDFFYTLADLMGIHWPGEMPERSFASPNFRPDVADRHIAGGKLVKRANQTL